MHKKILMLLVFFSLTVSCMSQSLFSKGDITVRTTPFSLLEMDGGIMLGAAYRFSENFSFTFDPTVIFLSHYPNEFSYSGLPFGIKIRSDIRYHFRKPILAFRHCFIGVEFHFKHTGTTKEETFGINCIQDRCDYYRIDNYRELKTEFGIAYKSGLEIPLSRDYKWSLELYGGLGAKYLSFKDKNIPIDGSFMNGADHSLLPWEMEDRFLPFFTGGLKLVYRIR